MTTGQEDGEGAVGGSAVLTVVGAGPGTGAAVARRFAGEGYAVGLVARDREQLDAVVGALRADGVRAAGATADVLGPDALRAALRHLADALGLPDVLCFSPLPDSTLIKPVLDTSPADLSASLRLNVIGAAVAVAEVLPGMRARGRGALLFTTGSGALRPDPARAASGVTTSAAAVYVRMLHESLQPEGIRVVHTTVVGAVGPGLRHEPAAVAEQLWRASTGQDEAITVLG